MRRDLCSLVPVSLIALSLAPLAGATTVGACHDFTGGAKDCYGAAANECAGNGTTAGVGHYAFDGWTGAQSKTRCYAAASLFDSDDANTYNGVCYEYPESLSGGDTHAYCSGVVRDSSGGYCVGGWTWDRSTDTRVGWSCTTIVVRPITIIFSPPLLA